MGNGVGDVFHIVCHTGHNFTRLIVVKVGIRQLLQVIEHIGSHLCLHTDTDHVTPILDKITQIHTDDVQKQKSRTADDQHTDILGVNIPMVTIPITPGRNLAVILEVAAMNNRQKKMGYNAAQELLKRLGMVDDVGEAKEEDKDIFF